MIHNKFWQTFFALAPIVIGFLSIGLYVYFVLDLVSDIQAVEAMGKEPDAAMILGNVAWFIGFILLIVLISLSSLIFYIVHSVQNPNLKGNNLLIVWILLFIFFSGIGQLIYWIVEIVSKKTASPTSS
jgi:hypothetical protein